MKIVTVASQKGGAGKTNTARNFAVAALLDGRRVALVDADPQRSAAKWAGRRKLAAPTVFTTEAQPLPAVLDDARSRGAELVIIDTPPHLRAAVSMAAEAADVIVIPVRPFPDDLEAVGDTVGIVRGTGRPAAILLNATPTRAKATDMARAALATFGLPVIPQAIADRIAHPYATAAGLGVLEYEPAGTAAAEVSAAWRDIVERFGL